jgi:hypothetical protein
MGRADDPFRRIAAVIDGVLHRIRDSMTGIQKGHAICWCVATNYAFSAYLTLPE